MNSIFGLDKNTLLKRNIIDTLDRQTTPFTYKELAESIRTSSVTTLQTNCKELADLMEELYPDQSCSLLIQKESYGIGLTLLRSSDNLQTFYDYLYSSDLAYEILYTLLFERNTSTVLFCMNHGLSESSLKRKIKDINDEIKAFGLRITCAKQLSLKGPEVKIRTFHYIFLRSVHRQFFALSGEQNLPENYQLGKNIAAYLGVAYDLTLVERFAYWTLIATTALSKGKKLQLRQEDKKIMQSLQFPDKPDFLIHWSLDEWAFLLTVVYCSLSENFQLPLNVEKLQPSALQESWLRSFQKHFRLLTSEEEQLVYMKLNQLHMTIHFFPLSRNFLATLQDFIGLDDLNEMYPLYLQHFEAFWQEWSPVLAKEEAEMFRMFSLSTCISIIPMEELLPTIAIHIYSEASDSFKQYVKIKLNYYYSTRYDLLFVEAPEKADLLIGTVPFYDTNRSLQQRTLVVRARISQKDLENISERLQELLERSKAT